MVQMIVNGTLTAAPACFMTVFPSARSITYLYNDTASALIGPAYVSSSGTVQNSQCTVNAAASSVTVSGNSLTVNLAVSFPASFTGAKSVYALVQTAAGVNSGWQVVGSWTVR
jgi:hypothetical protein